MAEQYGRQKYAGLEFLSTDMLEQIIRSDFDGDAEYSEEMIQYILEVIATRENEPQRDSDPDTQEAWNKFQLLMDESEQLYQHHRNVQTKDGNNSGKKSKPMLRYVGIAAACVAIVFVMLITVQAVGVNIFGALASWTESTFSIELNKTEKSKDYTGDNAVAERVGAVLEKMIIPSSSAPTQMLGDYMLWSIERNQTPHYTGVCVVYVKQGNEKPITIVIEKHDYDISGVYKIYMKNPGTPTVYEKDGMQFYIFENSDTWTATWSDGEYCITLAGLESIETAIHIINMIQEDLHD